jgi:hypothetical protein
MISRFVTIGSNYQKRTRAAVCLTASPGLFASASPALAERAAKTNKAPKERSFRLYSLKAENWNLA